MTPERIAHLEALPGWWWRPSVSHEEAFDCFCAHVNTYGFIPSALDRRPMAANHINIAKHFKEVYQTKCLPPEKQKLFDRLVNKYFRAKPWKPKTW
jgi:hypothetical protein